MSNLAYVVQQLRQERDQAQKRIEQPANRVVKVSIDDARGSYSITFADGNGESMIVD